MSRILGAADWLLLAFAFFAAVLRQGVRPVTWRRSVRAEAWRFLDFVCVRNLVPMLVAAALVGLLLVSQGLYWLGRFGESDAVREVIAFVVVREVGPLVVGLIVLGTGGIVLIGQLSALRTSGQLDLLERQGIDPFLLFVVPRVVALVVAVFAHSVLFVIVAFAAGYGLAAATGATPMTPAAFAAAALAGIGATGYLILPAKSLAIGATIGVVCCLTALQRLSRPVAAERLTAAGFLRAVTGILLVDALLSLAL